MPAIAHCSEVADGCLGVQYKPGWGNTGAKPGAVCAHSVCVELWQELSSCS